MQFRTFASTAVLLFGSAAINTTAVASSPPTDGQSCPIELGGEQVGAVDPLPERGEMTVAINMNVAFLPLALADDRGWFECANVDLDLRVGNEPLASQIPLLIRNDIQIAPVAGNPGLFNQLSEGFDLKLIVGVDQFQESRVSPAWLAVRADLADEINDLEDLRGRRVEGTELGSGVSLLMLETLRAGGLVAGDDLEVDFITRNPAETLAFVEKDAYDVYSLIEPMASQLEDEGRVVRWKTFYEIMPWYQGFVLATNGTFIDEHRDTLVKFLEVYTLASRAINLAEGEWTPELIEVAEGLTGFEPEVIAELDGVPFYPPENAVSVESLERSQRVWVEQDVLADEVDVSPLLAPDLLDEALANLDDAG